ncbi:MAG: diaminopimelate epimerase [Kiritimatiellae bacterium]|nr:diaminopimelate epimerase [Kiritimatiellia bacterium]MDW8458044.1 diaminopimelate epimerase [Verrucomicrobiota bacterium]
MAHKIPFWKMHGASNDFIVVDDRTLAFPTHDADWLRAIMARRTGVGSEGVLLIQPSERADFRMRFFNPDGGEVDMCGNGARCIAKLAFELGIAPSPMRFETRAGIVGAEILEDGVRLTMTSPRDWRLDGELEIDGRRIRYDFVNSGVPHAVVRVDNLAAVDVTNLGAAIRRHPAFAPNGTNANFVQVLGPDSIAIRTFERGVEAETLACGTGIVASGLIVGKLGLARPPVRVRAASGDVLTVDYRLTAEGAEEVTLAGPAVHVFEGVLSYPG